MQVCRQAAGWACSEREAYAARRPPGHGERRVNKLQSPSRSHRLDPGVSYVSLVTQQAASGVITHNTLPTMSVCSAHTPFAKAIPA